MKAPFQFQSARKDLIFWALVPLGLVLAGYVGSWWWHSAGWFSILRLPPPYYLTLGILTVGVVVGLKGRLLPWAYSWVAQALYHGSPLLVSLITMTFLPAQMIIDSDVQMLLSIASQGLDQLVVFVALACSLFLVKRNRVDAFFLFLLFLSGRTVSFPVQPAVEMLVPSGSVTAVLAVLALGEAVVVGLTIFHFLTGSPNSWKPVRWLLFLVLLDPAIKLWPVMLQGGAFSNNLLSYGTALLVSSFFTVGSLAAIFVSVHLYDRLRIRAAVGE